MRNKCEVRHADILYHLFVSRMVDNPRCSDCLATLFKEYFNQDIPYSNVKFTNPKKEVIK